MDIGQRTTTSISGSRHEVEMREPFPWLYAIAVWSWCIAAGVIAAIAVWAWL